MSTRSPSRLARVAMRVLVLILAVGVLAACSRRHRPRARRLPDGSRLSEGMRHVPRERPHARKPDLEKRKPRNSQKKLF